MNFYGQLTILIIFVVDFGLCVDWCRRYPHKKGYILPVASWAFHGIVFYTALVTNVVATSVAMAWNEALRLHGVLAIAAALIALRRIRHV